MSKKFGLTQEQYQLIQKILLVFLPHAKIYIFGSRARGDHKKYSDLDLAIEEKEPCMQKTLTQIQENFDQSFLPFKVDLLELSQMNPEFKKSIAEDLKKF